MQFLYIGASVGPDGVALAAVPQLGTQVCSMRHHTTHLESCVQLLCIDGPRSICKKEAAVCTPSAEAGFEGRVDARPNKAALSRLAAAQVGALNSWIHPYNPCWVQAALACVHVLEAGPEVGLLLIRQLGSDRLLTGRRLPCCATASKELKWLTAAACDSPCRALAATC